MFVAGLIFSILSALLHIFIFYMESFAWTGEKSRTVFGLTQDEAENTREMAFNQGFYNLFLAIEVLCGCVLQLMGNITGIALVLFGTGSMFAAALLLFITSPDKRIAAAKQGTFPLLALICLIYALML